MRHLMSSIKISRISIIGCSALLLLLASLVGCSGLKQAKPNDEPAESVKAEKMPRPDEKIGELVAVNDWEGIVALLGEVGAGAPDEDPCALDAVVRFLYGHASLSTGKLNTAVKHFYCTVDVVGAHTLAGWHGWTKDLVNKYPDSSAAHYLYGDALARDGEYLDSVKELDRSIELDPMNAMALNARGVVKFIVSMDGSGEETYTEVDARNDLVKAEEVSPEFIDAAVNRGVIGLVQEGGIDYALHHFDRALSYNPTYWMAMNGKVVAYGARGDYALHEKYISEIEEQAPDTPFLKKNKEGGFSQNHGDGARGVKIDAQYKPLGIGGGISIDFGKMDFAKYGAFGGFMRGGIYLRVKKDENLVVSEGRPRVSGTWFALNYPVEETAAPPDQDGQPE